MTILECLISITVSLLATLGVFTLLICFRKKLPENFPFALVNGLVAGVICFVLNIMISN